MKCLLTALNAKFIHTNLALRSLFSYSQQLQSHISILECTINQEKQEILQEIYEQRPDILCFSCYLWNIELVYAIISDCKKIIPGLSVWLGGPEVSFNAKEILEQNPNIDIILRGEGERVFQTLLEACLAKPKTDLSNIPGITFRKDDQVLETLLPPPLSLDEIPFVYQDLQSFQNKIIYYETQRGCPYQCQYCLSSLEKGVRFLSLDRVERELSFFLQNNVKQVKLVDRTFNCNKNHALHIWNYLIQHDNGISNFHMEIAGELLDEDCFQVLKHARPGLLQFEIGVQSTHGPTLQAIQRVGNFEQLKKIVQALHLQQNIHLHLDLIAGLPYENFEQFRQSFLDVYALKPEQFQLGFLKILKGSGLHRNWEALGLVYSQQAPYEILKTNELSYSELITLKQITQMIELFFNSFKAKYTLSFITANYKTPFDFYWDLSIYWKEKHLSNIHHNKKMLYEHFYQFCQQSALLQSHLSLIQELLALDIFKAENCKNLPSFLNFTESPEWRAQKRAFFQDPQLVAKYIPELSSFSSAQLSRMCLMYLFQYDIPHFLLHPDETPPRRGASVLFLYHRRNPLTNEAEIIEIP